MSWSSVEAALAKAETPDVVVRIFKTHYENLCRGAESFIREDQIEPVTDVVDAERLDASTEQVGRDSLGSVAVLKLNGGLGTSMGLEGPKSLLPVRGDQTFLHLILKQAEKLSLPLVLMNSFSTQRQTDDAIQKIDSKASVYSFLQHQVPKIDAESLEPIDWPADPNLQWCPPGHGDIYAALVTSGTLEQLLSDGRRYLFVSNADNLGATLDLGILGHFVNSGSPFLMEVADRTAADRKGGHLAKSEDGGLLLREKAQCHPDEEDLFQDTSRHSYFNTNNLWLDLQAIKEYLDQHEGFIPLPTIVNRKTVDPTDGNSPAVYQLETAMGAAIASLPGSDAIRVPRSRFAPVKTTSDLMAVRSDAYEIREDSSVGLVAERNGVPPTIELDGAYFKKIADLESRVPSVPSLVGCEVLEVEGDLRLAPGITCVGKVKLTGKGVTVPAGTYEGEHDFGDESNKN